MKDFKENNCRICKRVFCCKKCREKHETVQHDVFPGCDICVFGQTEISTPSQIVLTHIKAVHWPLHCLLCKRLFGSLEELFQHIKCPLGNATSRSIQKSPYTPHQSGLSPSYFEKEEFYRKKISIVSNLATSTPMQTEQDNNLLEKIHEVIGTPVDSSNNTKNNSDCSSFNLKRKVTFCETPIADNFSKKPKSTSLSVTGEKYTTTQFLTPSSAISERSTYYTATENLFEKIMENNAVTPIIMESTEDEKIISENAKSTNFIIHREEKTVWINAAINITSHNIEDDESSSSFNISNNQFFTPMVPKKKINIVAPSPLVKQDNLSMKYEGPVQISSTPNNSIIPVKSAPTVKDIFKSIGPSTSKSNLDNWESVEDKFGITATSKDCSNVINSSENSLPNHLWTSVTKLVKNVIQSFSNSLNEGTTSTSTSLKRYYSEQDLHEDPHPKRYKVSDVQCRKTIRDMTPINRYMQSYRHAKSREFRINIANSLTIKTFADKATQTDHYLLID